MRVLENLQPEKVFYYFEEICNIPHGSRNLDAISSYLEKFARDRELYVIRDEYNNIIIVKDATPGYEEVDPIILQGHMDMVAVKKSDCDIDMEKDPLRLKIEGDYIYAEGTSLGGDDGVAVAYILAVLDDDSIQHPRIEAVITTDEEIGMEGAVGIDLSMLKSTRMLNIDSEEEGILLTSCAGGARVDCNIPVIRESREGSYFQIEVGGLTGGHSGTEINKGHANAIKLVGRVLKMVQNIINIQIAELTGGEKDNAIPRGAQAVVYVPDGMEKAFEEEIEQINAIIKNENISKETDLYICSKRQPIGIKNVLDIQSTNRVVDFLELLPNGVISMSADIEGLVETSLNVGVLRLEQDKLVSYSAVRSSIESAKRHIMSLLKTLTELSGGTVSSYGEYPGWQYKKDSRLRETMVETYKEMFGQDVKVEAIHAGLECGIMISKLPGLDCVSFGPNIYNIHTTEEKLSISSTKRMWEYLLAVLKKKI